MIIKGGSGAVGSNYIGQTYIAGSPTPLQYLESYDDAIFVGDVGISRAIKDWAEAIGLTEAFGTLKIFFISFAESIGLTEAYSTVGTFIRSFSEALGLSEIVSKVLPSKEWSDNISVSDSLTKAIEVIKSEVILLAEGFANTVGKIFADTFNITDTMSSIVALVKEYVDTLAITDTATKAIAVVGSTLVGISDSIKRRVNGMLILWEKITNTIATWTAREKSTGEYSTIEKKTNDEWTARGVNDGSYSQVTQPDNDWTKLKDENE